MARRDATPQRTAVYARISDDTEGRAAGVTRQIEDSFELASRTGWTPAPYESFGRQGEQPQLDILQFVDNDIGASTRSRKKRDAFAQLMEWIKAGRIDGVVFYSNSRLTRRPREFEDIIELVERTGVQLNSVVSGKADLATADGRHIARILASTDAAEAERTSERVMRTFMQRREEGKPNPSSRAFGFEAGGETICDSEAKLIQEAAARIVNEGWSLGQVVRDWNARGIPTVRKAPGWNRAQVSRALLSPRSAGLIAHHGEILGPGKFEAILTPAMQAQVREALHGRRLGNTVSFRQRKHALAGFLVCGKCNRPMKVNALYDENGDDYRKDSFVVCSRSQYGCGGVKRNLRHVEQFIDGAVRARIAAAEPRGSGNASSEAAERIDEVNVRLQEIGEDINALQAAFKANEIRFKDYNVTLSALRSSQEVAERTLRELREGEATNADKEDLAASWDSDDVDDRRKVLATYFDHIKLYPIGKVGPIRAKAMIPETTVLVPR